MRALKLEKDVFAVKKKWFAYCPEHPGTEMFFNVMGNWECPTCKLQINYADGGATILQEPGRGNFQLVDGACQSAVDYPTMKIVEITHDLRTAKA